MRTFTLAVLLAAASTSAAQPPEPAKLPMPIRDVVTPIETFNDTDTEVRVSGANAVAALGEPALKPLIAALGDSKAEVRSSAAYALGLMGVEAVPSVAGLVKLLKDADKEVRKQSAQALSRILLAQRQPNAPMVAPGVPAIIPPPPPPPVFPETRP